MVWRSGNGAAVSVFCLAVLLLALKFLAALEPVGWIARDRFKLVSGRPSKSNASCPVTVRSPPSSSTRSGSPIWAPIGLIFSDSDGRGFFGLGFDARLANGYQASCRASRSTVLEGLAMNNEAQRRSDMTCDLSTTTDGGRDHSMESTSPFRAFLWMGNWWIRSRSPLG